MSNIESRPSTGGSYKAREGKKTPIPKRLPLFRVGDLGKERVLIVDSVDGKSRRKGRKLKLEIDGVSGLLFVPPSITTGFSILSDPGKVFIPDGQGKSREKQEKLARHDTVDLRRRTGLRDIEVRVGTWISNKDSKNVHPVRLIVQTK